MKESPSAASSPKYLNACPKSSVGILLIRFEVPSRLVAEDRRRLSSLRFNCPRQPNTTNDKCELHKQSQTAIYADACFTVCWVALPLVWYLHGEVKKEVRHRNVQTDTAAEHSWSSGDEHIGDSLSSTYWSKSGMRGQQNQSFLHSGALLPCRKRACNLFHIHGKMFLKRFFDLFSGRAPSLRLNKCFVSCCWSCWWKEWQIRTNWDSALRRKEWQPFIARKNATRSKHALEIQLQERERGARRERERERSVSSRETWEILAPRALIGNRNLWTEIQIIIVQVQCFASLSTTKEIRKDMPEQWTPLEQSHKSTLKL